MNLTNVIKSVFVVALMAFGCLSGCTSLNQQAFMNTQANSLRLVQDKDTVRDAVVSTLTEKGFQSEFSGNIVKGTKRIKNGRKTTTVTLDCSLLNNSRGGTLVQASAMTEVYKSSSHVKVFWLIFIPIPYGSYVTGAVVSSDTIYDKEFYASFFDSVAKKLADMGPVEPIAPAVLPTPVAAVLTESLAPAAASPVAQQPEAQSLQIVTNVPADSAADAVQTPAKGEQALNKSVKVTEAAQAESNAAADFKASDPSTAKAVTGNK